MPGRLHNLSATIKAITPAEYKNGNLTINYSFAPSPFGDIIIASTVKGVCYLAFIDDEMNAFAALQSSFLQSVFKKKSDHIQQCALRFFTENRSTVDRIKLHVKGTDFQLKVWKALLKIPMGQLSTYGNIAKRIGLPRAVRAVGTAVGANPVAFIVPCHRVIRSTGALGKYHWGSARKAAMIDWETAQKTPLTHAIQIIIHK